eukprot:11932002-Heterocapsa_arctica.AAC.1
MTLSSVSTASRIFTPPPEDSGGGPLGGGSGGRLAAAVRASKSVVTGSAVVPPISVCLRTGRNSSAWMTVRPGQATTQCSR